MINQLNKSRLDNLKKRKLILTALPLISACALDHVEPCSRADNIQIEASIQQDAISEVSNRDTSNQDANQPDASCRLNKIPNSAYFNVLSMDCQLSYLCEKVTVIGKFTDVQGQFITLLFKNSETRNELYVGVRPDQETRIHFSDRVYEVLLRNLPSGNLNMYLSDVTE